MIIEAWAEVEKIEVEVEVGKLKGNWRTKYCYQYKWCIEHEALGGNKVLALLDDKTSIN